MILRRVRALVPADLSTLPRCPEGCLSGVLDPDSAWARAAMQRWGQVGLSIDGLGQPAGYLLISPAATLPPGHPMAGHEAEESTAVLVALTVVGQRRHTGIARHLVQSSAARLVGRANALEAVGSRVGSTCQSPAARWLHQIGFEVCGEMDWLPAGAQRLRLDLTRTVGWHAEVDRLLAPFRRAPQGWVTPATDRVEAAPLPRVVVPVGAPPR